MANVSAKDFDGVEVFLKASGAGSDGDPHIVQHLESNSANVLVALQAIQSAVQVIDNFIAGNEGQVDVVSLPGSVVTDIAAIKTAIEILDNAISGSEAQVDVLTLPADPLGANADATVAAGDAGSISAKLRRLTADLDAVKTALQTLDNIVSGSEAQVDVLTLPADPLGANADAATTAGGAGSISAKLRLLTTDIDAIKASLATLDNIVSGNEAQVDIVAAIPAGENHAMQVGGEMTVVEVTLSLDTSAYISGDVLADTQSVSSAFRVAGGTAILQSISVLDSDDLAGALDIVILDDTTSIGTENQPVSISDADASHIKHIETFVSTDYADLINSRRADSPPIGKPLKAAGGSTSLGLAAISRDTKTYSASGIKVQLGILWN